MLHNKNNELDSETGNQQHWYDTKRKHEQTNIQTKKKAGSGNGCSQMKIIVHAEMSTSSDLFTVFQYSGDDEGTYLSLYR